VSDDVPFRLPPVDPSAAADVPSTSLSPELLAGLLADGDDELAAWTLRHAMDESSRGEVYDGLLREAMALVGDRWITGRWSIAEEHLASRTLLRTLERLRPTLGPEGRIGPLAVLAGVAGEHHMIGLACLEQLLVEDGWSVANLGADLPAEDLGVFVARNDVALVALSAMDGARVGVLADAVQAVRDAAGDRPIGVVVGGGIASVPGLKDTVQADGVAHSLTEAVDLARAHRPG
jgi:MerR family transcriptional regulator, light-induced transcriptional regulator